ncbi:alpha beta hydrolase fold protein [Paramyrothecium foliicola]|nr:alpha beta hydrolase fold protein [Paramyrothecium foliicola]
MQGGAILPLNGTDIFYTVQGPECGIPILLVHGWSCDMTDWAFQIATLLLAQSLQVITMDLRGHGRTRVHSNTTAFDAFTLSSDVVALLMHLGVTAKRQAIVVGHSFGGTAVTELVAEFPDLIAGHVVIDPSYYVAPEEIPTLIDIFRPDFDKGYVQFLTRAYTPDTPHWIPRWHTLRGWGADEQALISIQEQMADTLRPGLAKYLKQKKVPEIPRLVIPTMQSGVDVELEAGLDEDFEQLVLMKGDHWPFQSKSGEFNHIIGNWLKIWGWVPKNRSWRFFK